MDKNNRDKMHFDAAVYVNTRISIAIVKPATGS